MSPSLLTMGFFMSDINFCNTKEQLNHLGEVVTGKVDGSPTGADIDTSTLSYTGQVRKTLPALEGEYEQSITDKEAEADAAIDTYRLLSKGDYASGILLSNNFEFIEYDGAAYFATSPPYTTTSTTPDSDSNLFISGYTTLNNVISALPGYTDIVYKASGVNSAMENMIAGVPVFASLGDICSTGGTHWECTSANPSTYADFRPVNDINVNDYGIYGGAIIDERAKINELDDIAYSLGRPIYYPYATYRVTGPINRKVEHYGEQLSPQVYSEIVCDNSTAFTLLASTGVGTNPQRSVDLTNMKFSSVQSRIHKLLDADMYRGQIKNVFASGFDVGLDLAGVYIDFENFRVSDCNIGVYPRKQLLSGTPSTMWSFNKSLFLGNTVGFRNEQRSASPTSDDDLISLSFENTGFEQNSEVGFDLTQRVWYLNTKNCWSEANGKAYEISNSFTDWTDVSSRWDDANKNSNAREVEVGFGKIRADSYETKVDGENYQTSRTVRIIVKDDGTVISNGNEGLVTSAVISSGNLSLTLSTILTHPTYHVTPIYRQSGFKLECSTFFDNTTSASDVQSLGKVNRFVTTCYNFDDASTPVIPYWYVIDIGA